MPGLDGTGPQGYGPMTGGGWGVCGAAGLGRGRGRSYGMGRGLGRGYRGGRGPVNGIAPFETALTAGGYSDKERLIVLKREAEVLKEQVEQMEGVIGALEKSIKDQL